VAAEAAIENKMRMHMLLVRGFVHIVLLEEIAAKRIEKMCVEELAVMEESASLVYLYINFRLER